VSLDDFKARTLGKLEQVECPQHRQRPQVSFHGSRLRDVTISIRSCCRELSGLANLAIASPVDVNKTSLLRQ
jgi:hypothetical protein